MVAPIVPGRQLERRLRLVRSLHLLLLSFAPSTATTVACGFNIAECGDNLRDAVAAAESGAILELEDGTYGGGTSSATLVISSGDVTLRARTPGRVVLHGEGMRQVVDISGSATKVTLEGINVTGGSNAAGNGGGLAIRLGANVRMNECSIHGNSAQRGGGMDIDRFGTVAMIIGCTIHNNEANATNVPGSWGNGDGGGLSIGFGAVLTMRGCIVYGNRAVEWGGGLEVRAGADLTMSSCALYDNRAGVKGGGLDMWGGTLKMSSCTVQANEADEGGGLAISQGASEGTTVTISNCSIYGNDAAFRGGGLSIAQGDSGADVALLLTNATVLFANTAPVGANWGFTRGTMLYQLPTPPGRWIAGVECTIFREPCTPSSSPACSAAKLRECSLSASASDCQSVRVLQPCNWDEQPELLGETVQVLGYGDQEDDYPFACAAGVRGAIDAAEQAGPQCAGMCAAGTYRQDIAEVDCRLCPEGAYCPRGAATPIACPDGTHGTSANLTSAAECVACPAGSWCNSGQAFRCGAGLVAVGDAANRTNLGACVPCPDEHATTRDVGTSSMADCVCEVGFLSDPHGAVDATRRCTACPSNLDCPAIGTMLFDLVVAVGHWRPGFNSTDARPCPYPNACASGMTAVAVYDRSDSSTCAAGRGVTGAFCLLCIEGGHYFDAAKQRCLPCAASVGGAIVLLILPALVFASAWLACRWQAARVESMWRRWRAYARKLSFRAKLQTMISFLQILTQLERVYMLQFPPAFSELVGVLSVVNIDLGWVPSLRLSCLVTRSLGVQLLITSLVPLGVTLVAPLVATLRGKPLATSLPYVLGWTFLVMPSTASFGFRALAPCECFALVDGGEQCFLREDYEVECTAAFRGRAVPPLDVLAAAWFTVLVWAVGVPLLYVSLLLRRELRPALGMLCGDYRPAAAAWSLVVVGEKLVLTGFLALVDPGSWMQLFIGALLAFFAFALQARVAPYRTPSDNLFAFLSSLSLVAVFQGSLSLHAYGMANELDLDADSTAELGLLFAATLLVLLAAVLFFVAELRRAREILLVQATRQPPALTLAMDKTWHAFLSHNWANQDVAATIKRQLQLLLPDVCIFLDVDNLESVDALEGYMRESQAVLILLGSPRYFGSHNCLREVVSAAALRLPPIGVHEADASKHGAPLAELRKACPEEHRGYVFGDDSAPPPIAWHRVRDFQMCSLAQIAERVLLACPERAASPSRVAVGLPLCIDGGLAWARLGFGRKPVAVYESEHNPSVAAVGRELRERFGPSALERASEAGGSSPWILMLSADAFDGAAGERLAAEVETALKAGVRPVMVYDPEESAFGAIIDATPTKLKELKMYDALAIEWRAGALLRVSVALVAKALGATTFGASNKGWWTDQGGSSSASRWRAVGTAVRACRGLAAVARVGQKEEGLIEGNEGGGVRAIEMREEREGELRSGLHGRP